MITARASMSADGLSVRLSLTDDTTGQLTPLTITRTSGMLTEQVASEPTLSTSTTVDADPRRGPTTYTFTDPEGAVAATCTIDVPVPAPLPSDDLAAQCMAALLSLPDRAGQHVWVGLLSIGDADYGVDGSRHNVAGRPLPVYDSALAHLPAFDMTVLTATAAQRNALLSVMYSGEPVLMRIPAPLPESHVYLSVAEVTESRIMSDQRLPMRRWSMNCTEVRRPRIIEVVDGVRTWEDVEREFPSWWALEATGITWGDLESSAMRPALPMPPPAAP